VAQAFQPVLAQTEVCGYKKNLMAATQYQRQCSIISKPPGG